MQLSEYVKKALRTENVDFEAIAQRFNVLRTVRIVHAAFGFADEVGEIFGALKKHLFYGKPLDEVNLIEEQGDLLWYWALMCSALGVDPVVIMEKNIAKLQARYPDKYTDHDALNRDVAKEREALEK